MFGRQVAVSCRHDDLLIDAPAIASQEQNVAVRVPDVPLDPGILIHRTNKGQVVAVAAARLW